MERDRSKQRFLSQKKSEFWRSDDAGEKERKVYHVIDSQFPYSRLVSPPRRVLRVLRQGTLNGEVVIVVGVVGRAGLLTAILEAGTGC